MKEKVNSGSTLQNRQEVNRKALQELDKNKSFEESDDFSVEFTALNKGLGFHQKSEKSQTVMRKASFAVPHEKRQASAMNSFYDGPKKSIESANIERSQGMSDSLKAFYSNNTSSDILNIEKVNPLSPRDEVLDLIDVEKGTSVIFKLRQVMAWIIDLLCISSLMGLTYIGLSVVAGVSPGQFSMVLTTQESLIFSFSFFTLYYLMFFSVLDLVSTPGKALFHLRVVAIEPGSRLTVWQTFLRALVSFLSLFLIFVPLLFDFQSKISDTKTIDRNV